MTDLLTRPLSSVSFADIEGLAASGAEEGLRLEFKRELPANQGQRDPWMSGAQRIGNPAKDDIAKEVVAFANAYGGLLVVGIDETDDNPRRAAGLSNSLVPRVFDCAEQLQQSLQQLIDPPMPMLEVRGIERPGGSGEGILLIRTSLSPRAPHGFRNPPLVYVRRGSRSEPLGMRDIQAMLFETRTRAERIEAERRERANAFRLLNERASRGTLKSFDGMPFEPNDGALGFRSTLLPSDDINFHELPDHVGRNSFFRPDCSSLTVWMRDVLGMTDHLKGLG